MQETAGRRQSFPAFLADEIERTRQDNARLSQRMGLVGRTGGVMSAIPALLPTAASASASTSSQPYDPNTRARSLSQGRPPSRSRSDGLYDYTYKRPDVRECEDGWPVVQQHQHHHHHAPPRAHSARRERDHQTKPRTARTDDAHMERERDYAYREGSLSSQRLRERELRLREREAQLAQEHAMQLRERSADLHYHHELLAQLRHNQPTPPPPTPPHNPAVSAISLPSDISEQAFDKTLSSSDFSVISTFSEEDRVRERLALEWEGTGEGEERDAGDTDGEEVVVIHRDSGESVDTPQAAAAATLVAVLQAASLRAGEVVTCYICATQVHKALYTVHLQQHREEGEKEEGGEGGKIPTLPAPTTLSTPEEVRAYNVQAVDLFRQHYSTSQGDGPIRSDTFPDGADKMKVQ